MVTLTFDRAAVASALTHSRDASRRSPNRQQAEEGITDTPAGLWLVSDHGIYLMSNGQGADGRTGKSAHPVVHAHECDPSMPFDQWWSTKRRFGLGDSSDFIDASEIEPALGQAFAEVGLVFFFEPLDVDWHCFEAVPDPLWSEVAQ